MKDQLLAVKAALVQAVFNFEIKPLRDDIEKVVQHLNKTTTQGCKRPAPR